MKKIILLSLFLFYSCSVFKGSNVNNVNEDIEIGYGSEKKKEFNNCN
jgi:hypothetical protein